ncbi:MAG TPA: PmoA family protein, partial [Chloroflexota bacterium]|nr:PmoA family protein [Chloroflexota bacterium]
MTPPAILRITAGDYDRDDCPIRVAGAVDQPDGPVWLVDDETSRRIPAQIAAGELWTVVDEVSRGTSRRYHLLRSDSTDHGVHLGQGDERYDLSIDGAPFTSYHFGTKDVRPYFYPLLGQTGIAMTRNYPMRSDVEGESTDHPHHRSLYVAFGDVNGVDVWAEPPNPNTGRIVHRSWNKIAAGPVVVSLDESLTWVDGREQPLLDETRQIRTYLTKTTRFLDLDLTFTPSREAVLFGDTKEGGPLAVRVASPLEGSRGGMIENAYGARREAETWGKRAPWVDYSGKIQGDQVGIAIMDHPTSFRHPTWWHVR